jgi:hypothetical protein
VCVASRPDADNVVDPDEKCTPIRILASALPRMNLISFAASLCIARACFLGPSKGTLPTL